MSDLIDDPAPGQNAPEFTVSEISGAVKRTIEGAFGRVRVRGEVGRVFRARSGHLYYDIKDDNNVLACTTWKGQAARLSVMPEEGLEVIVTGKLTAFGAQSKYNMNVDEVVVAGEGALMAMLEKRKKALAAEGLFAPERKRALPYLPEIVGVVTSPSGAVIRDILHRLRERFPRKVLIWPVAVQGAACAPEVARAIEGFNRLTPGGALPRPDLLIVARGGGSIEDLWGFNEEIVARAVAASEIPLISAVGHETDTTLIDFVSDKRAPTPTAAAELAVPVRLELMGRVDEQGLRLTRALTQDLARRGQRLADLARVLPRPATLTETAAQRLDLLGIRLDPGLRQVVQLKRLALGQVGARLRPGLLVQQQGTAAQRLGAASQRLGPALGAAAQRKRLAFAQAAAGLRANTLQQDLERKRAAFDGLAARLSRAGAAQVLGWSERLGALERMRQSLGYEQTLQRGYAVVRAGETVVTSKAQAEEAGALEIQFRDGRLALSGKARGRGSKTRPPEQGSLF